MHLTTSVEIPEFIETLDENLEHRYSLIGREHAHRTHGRPGSTAIATLRSG